MPTLTWLVVSPLVFAVAACSGDVPPTVDAIHMCTGATYDPCVTEHDCPTGTCMPFDGFEACTVGCTPGDNTSCPQQGSDAVTCGSNSLCAPTAPNVCTL